MTEIHKHRLSQPFKYLKKQSCYWCKTCGRFIYQDLNGGRFVGQVQDVKRSNKLTRTTKRSPPKFKESK
jgi:hypothetical protein